MFDGWCFGGPLRAALLSFSMLLAAGCSIQPTPYQAVDKGYGYSQQQLDGRTWRVEFSGNSVTSRATVENYLLYRAAEIMRFGGYDRFIVLEKDVERRDAYYTTGYGPHLGVGRYSRDVGVWYSAPLTHRVSRRYAGVMTVRVHSGGSFDSSTPSYRVDEVMQQLAGTIILPKAKQAQ